MASYITLAEYSQLREAQGDLLTSGIVDTLIEDGGVLLEKLPIKTTGRLQAKGHRILDLPSAQNRSLNEGYTHGVGHSEPLEETAFMYGGRVQWDYLLDGSGDDMIENPEAFQMRLHTKAQTFQLKYDLINNTPPANAEGLVGLRHRLAQDLPSTQRIDAGGVDISDDSAGTSDAAYVQKLRRLIYALPDHTCDALLMNDTALLATRRVLDNLSLLSSAEDQFHREIYSWGKIPLVDMGLKGDQATKIITDEEDATGKTHDAGGTTTFTSIFAVRFGPEYLTGWEKQGMKTFRWSTGVLNFTEFDWALGLFITNPRSVAQLYDIQAA